MVKFDVTDEESAIVVKIVRRAREVSKSHGIEYSSKDISMDVIACHANGCKLDLQTLLDAPEDTFAHDIFGIRRFIDRTTGKINPVQFDPRCSMPTCKKCGGTGMVFRRGIALRQVKCRSCKYVRAVARVQA